MIHIHNTFTQGRTHKDAAMNHPLTDELCFQMSINNPTRHGAIRDAADWQLEQVIEWIKECPNREGFYHTHYEQDCESMIRDLKTAMRPQEDN